MDKKELEFILQEGEGLKIEFKESLKNIDREMVSLLPMLKVEESFWESVPQQLKII